MKSRLKLTIGQITVTKSGATVGNVEEIKMLTSPSQEKVQATAISMGMSFRGAKLLAKYFAKGELWRCNGTKEGVEIDVEKVKGRKVITMRRRSGTT